MGIVPTVLTLDLDPFFSFHRRRLFAVISPSIHTGDCMRQFWKLIRAAWRVFIDHSHPAESDLRPRMSIGTVDWNVAVDFPDCSLDRDSAGSCYGGIVNGGGPAGNHNYAYQTGSGGGGSGIQGHTLEEYTEPRSSMFQLCPYCFGAGHVHHQHLLPRAGRMSEDPA